MNKLIIPAVMIALALCGSQAQAGDPPSQTNIPTQIIARATGITGNQIAPQAEAQKYIADQQNGADANMKKKQRVRNLPSN